MTVAWTVYDSTTGEILRTGEAMTVAQANLQGNTAGTKVVVVGSDPVTQKVDVSNASVPTIITRPAPATIAVSKTAFLANGSDSVTISGIVNPSTYAIVVPTGVGILDIPIGTITDGSLVITTTVAGAYGITITNFPKADFTVTLNAS